MPFVSILPHPPPLAPGEKGPSQAIGKAGAKDDAFGGEDAIPLPPGAACNRRGNRRRGLCPKCRRHGSPQDRRGICLPQQGTCDRPVRGWRSPCPSWGGRPGMLVERKRRARKSKDGAGPWGSGNGRRRPCLSAEKGKCRRRDCHPSGGRREPCLPICSALIEAIG